VAPTGAAPARPTAVPPPAVGQSQKPLETAQRYLDAWKGRRYGEMYALLSRDSKAQYNSEYFLDRYTGITERATITSLEARLSPDALKAQASPEGLMRLPFGVAMKTQLFGDIAESNLMTLVNENGYWAVRWAPSMIFKDLVGDNRLRRERAFADRGTIYDRNGRPLAIDGSVQELGIVPAYIENEVDMLRRVALALGVTPQSVKKKYQGGDASQYFPVRKLTNEQATRVAAQLEDVPGVRFEEVDGRLYPGGTSLAQTIGRVTPISAEDLKRPEYAEYPADALIGQTGVERWGERYLRDVPGGRLYIATPEGEEVKVLKERPARPGNDIYLNIDLSLQRNAEAYLSRAIPRVQGSVVAIDPFNGEILTMVSLPSFDPNQFAVGISSKEFARLTATTSGDPFLNRATNGTYPMASTFKVVTASAALSALPGITTRQWICEGQWHKISGPVRGDWLDGGHGRIDLFNGIVQSCDIVFYDLGLDLYNRDIGFLSEHARAWGLGKELNVEGVGEKSGQVPGPGVTTSGWSRGDNVNLSIGQGQLQVTPLQAANLYATIANGGTIFRPNLIRKIVSADGSNKVIREFKPTRLGRAPASPQAIAFIKQALKLVTTTPKGTADKVFRTSAISAAGKTGTGEVDGKKPLAWFAGYAPAERARIAVVAMAQNAGQGSEIAAPVVRQVMENFLVPPGTTR
jgi:penicillin-binding protein 2